MGFVTDYEDDLIPSSEWKDLLEQTPDECRDIALSDPWSLGGPTGIGRNEELGWFIAGCGQGPFLIWNEKILKRRNHNMDLYGIHEDCGYKLIMTNKKKEDLKSLINETPILVIPELSKNTIKMYKEQGIEIL